MSEEKAKPKRRGVFMGFYGPLELKRALEQQARSEYRTLSQEMRRILEEAVKTPKEEVRQ